MGIVPRYVAVVRAVIVAPVQVSLFLADCVLRPRPWDSAAWTPPDGTR
jgi:hypothetical protein